MKATIVKNDNFKTVGFEFGTENNVMYKWGVAPIKYLYFVKEIDANKYLTLIFELIEIRAQLGVHRRFASTFFDIAEKSGIDCKKGVKFSEIDDKIKKLEQRTENIIESMI